MYSNSVDEWDGTAVDLDTQVGWMGQLWTALIAQATSEPSPDNTDWQLDTETSVKGITLSTTPDPIDYLQTKVTGITITETHVNKSEEVYLGGITLQKFRNKPYLKVNFY